MGTKINEIFKKNQYKYIHTTIYSELYNAHYIEYIHYYICIEKKMPHNITALQSYITWLQNIMDYCDVLGTGPLLVPFHSPNSKRYIVPQFYKTIAVYGNANIIFFRHRLWNPRNYRYFLNSKLILLLFSGCSL